MPSFPYRTCLVTGASGLLGSNFLIEASHRHPSAKWVGVSRRNKICLPGVESILCDLADEDALIEVLFQTKPDIIFHFASPTNVDWCEENPKECHREIVTVSAHLAMWCKKRNAKMVFMSTDSVFDGIRGNYTEEDRPIPPNVYARCKLLAEVAVAAEVPNYLIVRGNIFGWNAQPKLSLAEWFLKKLEEEGCAPGFIDSIFAPLLVNTLSDIMLAMVSKNLLGIWHAACSTPVSKHQFGVLLAQGQGLPAESIKPTLAAETAFKARRPLNTSLNSSPLATELNLPMPTIDSEIKTFFRLRETGFLDTLKNSIANNSL